MSDTTVDIVLKAKNIDDRATVTMKKGAKPYTFRTSLTVYSKIEGGQPFKMDGFFLIDPSGSITQIDGNTELKWSMTPYELFMFAQELMDLEECDVDENDY